MRRLLMLPIGMLTTVALVGCTALLGHRAVTLQNINLLIAEEEFGQALELLNDAPASHPQYALLQKRLGEVRKAATVYEQAIGRTLRTKMEQGDWSGALDHVNRGLEKLPSSAVLRQAREDVLKKRDQHIDDLKAEILITKGRWLAEDVRLHKELTRVAPGNLMLKWQLQRTRRAAENTAEKLYECGERARDHNNFELADRCLTLVDRLDPSDTMRAAVRDLRQHIAQREKDVRRTEHRAQREKLQQDYDRLAGLVMEAINNGELSKARQIVSGLAKIDPDNPDVHRLQEHVSETIAATVTRMLDQASKLYREEKIEEAEKTWKDVLQLDPSNKQAQAGIERATRVLENLRLLKKRESSPR
jgi:tetratricopeptide (TPR) repeat protein